MGICSPVPEASEQKDENAPSLVDADLSGHRDEDVSGLCGRMARAELKARQCGEHVSPTPGLEERISTSVSRRQRSPPRRGNMMTAVGLPVSRQYFSCFRSLVPSDDRAMTSPKDSPF